MKTLHKGMQLSLQNLSPTLPGTLFQPIGAGGFFADDKMSKINIYTPNSNTEDGTKFYPYFFNVNVGTDTSLAKNKTINLDIQVVDPNDATHVSVLRGSFTGSFKTVSGESSNIKGQAEVFLADESVVDFLGVCAGLQSSEGNYGIVVYIRGGLVVSGFSNANRVQACGANVGTVDFAGISYPIEIDAIPDNVLNRRNIMNFIASGAYSTTPNMYQVSSTGTSSPLQLGGGGSGNGTPTPLVRSSNTTGSDGTFYLMDLRAGGLVYTFPTEPEVGNMVWIGDYADSASILTPLILRSENPIHGELDDVIITAPSRTMWGYVDDNEGWVCLDGVGEIEESPLPYEEVEILPAAVRNINTGEITLPEGYKWTDFDRIEVSMGIGTAVRSYASTHITKESIRARVNWGVSCSYIGNTDAYRMGIDGVDDTKATWSAAANTAATVWPYQIKGYTAYKPILERPKRVTTLYEGPVVLNGQDVPLSESISKFDMILVVGHFNNGTETHTSTMMVRPEDILVSDSLLNVWRYSPSSTSFINITLNPTLSSDISLRVAAGSNTYTNPGITKVTGINWITQNEISGGGGGGKDPHVIKTTNFDIEMNTNIAVDMSDGVSKVASLPIGMLEGQWFKITVIGVTPETNIDGAFITIATPYNQWANNHTWVGFRFPAKTNASYEVQLINGYLTFINESGAGDVFVDAPWDDLPYNRRNGQWVEALPNENMFDNGNFLIDQRRIINNEAAFAGDRWQLVANGTDGVKFRVLRRPESYGITAPAYAPSDSKVPVMEFGTTSTDSNYIYISQKFLKPYLYSGKTLTWSGAINTRDINSVDVVRTVKFRVGYVLDGELIFSWLKAVVTKGDGTMTPFEFTFDLIDLDLYQNEEDLIRLEVILDESGGYVPNDRVQVKDFKLEESPFATRFVKPNPVTELQKCMAYYRNFGDAGASATTASLGMRVNVTSGNIYSVYTDLSPEMVIVPTIKNLECDTAFFNTPTASFGNKRGYVSAVANSTGAARTLRFSFELDTGL